MRLFMYDHSIVEKLSGNESIENYFGNSAVTVIEKFGQPDATMTMTELQAELNYLPSSNLGDEGYIYIFVE